MEARVKEAYRQKDRIIGEKLEARGLIRKLPIFIRAFKEEMEIEIWIKKTHEWILYDTFPICYLPGKPGPKHKEGDCQVPEGIYYIERFNPKSLYHLSLGINYPNEFDRSFADSLYPGGDIFIHGGCTSVGCLPVTDSLIEEIYILAEEARQNGQSQIPVHVFPCRMTPEKMKPLIDTYPQYKNFWRQLNPFYDVFEKQKMLPKALVSRSGYTFLNPKLKTKKLKKQKLKTSPVR